MTKQTTGIYRTEFKQEIAVLVTKQGHSAPEATASLGVTNNLFYRWKAKFEAEQTGASFHADERTSCYSY